MISTEESMPKSFQYHRKIGCVIMASGRSTRFGSNKLLAEFDGETLIQRILNITGGDLFAKRVVVTRTQEAADICKKQGVDVILHTLPERNDAVRLGAETMSEMEGLIFCPCDQPLLRRETLLSMTTVPNIEEDMILRLACKERVGTPILFGKKYLRELCSLPDKKGGSYLAGIYPEKVKYLFVKDERELMDADTPEDLQRLSSINRIP